MAQHEEEGFASVARCAQERTRGFVESRSGDVGRNGRRRLRRLSERKRDGDLEVMGVRVSLGRRGKERLRAKGTDGQPLLLLSPETMSSDLHQDGPHTILLRNVHRVSGTSTGDDIGRRIRHVRSARVGSRRSRWSSRLEPVEGRHVASGDDRLVDVGRESRHVRFWTSRKGGKSGRCRRTVPSGQQLVEL